jgi:hypothetical protein
MCQQILVKLPNVKFHENLLIVSLVVKSGQTDMPNIIVVILQFLVASAPRNRQNMGFDPEMLNTDHVRYGSAGS